MKQKKRKIPAFFQSFFQKIRRNRISFSVYILLYCITISVIILTALHGNWSGTFTGILALTLFLIPTVVEQTFRIELPTTLEIIVILFVFCAEILGEIGMYYTKYPFWDNMLHVTSGFIIAAFGFSLVDIANRNHRMEIHLSPLFLSLVACCFSISIGVLWEFFEFFGDLLLRTDMQKDFFLSSVSSSALNPESQSPIVINHIVQTAITLEDGTVYTVPGYLDIGLFDTMKDLMVDAIGAVAFSILGFFYVRHRGKGKLVQQFLPKIPPETSMAVAQENGDGESTDPEASSSEHT